MCFEQATETFADRLTHEASTLMGNQATQEMIALVAAGTELQGIIRFTGSVRIDGRVEGEIHAEGVVVIGNTAVIRATVTARAVVSCGTVIGDVSATESVKLLAPAVLRGCVRTPLLAMEEGVRFVGTLAVAQEGPEGQVLSGAPPQAVGEAAIA